MTFSLAEQTLVFLEAILIGAAGGVCYDICRALRRVLKTGRFGTGLLDGVFWMVMLAALFYFAVTDAAAQMRFYILLGEALGISLHFLCFTDLLLPLLCFIFASVGHFLAFVDTIIRKVGERCRSFLINRKKVVEFLKKIKKKLPFFRQSG